MQHQLVLSYLITEWKGKCNDLEDLIFEQIPVALNFLETSRSPR